MKSNGLAYITTHIYCQIAVNPQLLVPLEEIINIETIDVMSNKVYHEQACSDKQSAPNCSTQT